ncbi:fumarylacetoacetate hydrolase family protein [Halobacillus kuroshimensis]|uniref:Fumarylacetoacetate hydrolase family protein n=1 Tax=Halobacillus kuroshimensis TaxID=302481 RepID=A0ABS3DS44_9BACI|nr:MULTISPECIES: fumarylacetoacetate hydrolase family protein [Halobacillus]MBN8234170.1 fumarylacetoacetate hydrolase family protein [Halobacillus kuroshimensis]
MKFVRVSYAGQNYEATIHGDDVSFIEGDKYGSWRYTGEVRPLDQVRLLAPVEPKKVIGIGANYVAGVEERPEKIPDLPVFFLKPSSSVIGPEQDIEIPEPIEEVKFESELAVVIGKEAKNIAETDVYDYIFGYTIGNDVTAPQFFHEDGHWTVGKAFDTFTPLGPVVETDIRPEEVFVKADINGVETQNSPTSLMIVPLAPMIAYLSKVMTLHPGDVILTGSPLGAHFVKDQDIIECRIDDIGVLRNKAVRSSVSIES